MTTLALNNVRPYGEDVTNILIDVADGVIEIQGDHCDRVIEELGKQGHQPKRAGG